jgi:phosphoadenosine phosphosulfate reductase
MKTAPIEHILSQILEPENKALMFEGTRKEESQERQNNTPICCASKIAIQIAVRPILDWSSLEEWLYILGEKIPYNTSYRFGMRRVGCSICPMNSSWSEYVLKHLSPSLADYYVHLLRDSLNKLNVQVQINVDDYISKGKWKARSGGFGVGNSSMAEVTEWDEDYRFIRIGMQELINVNNLIEYLKPVFKICHFESLYSRVGGKSVILLSRDLNIHAKINIEGQHLSIWWFDQNESSFKLFLSGLKKQLIKYRFCAYCRGCETKCAFQAIKVDGNNCRYVVDSSRCTGCGECVDIKVGCLLAKSVKSTSAYTFEKDVVNAR